MNSTPDHTAASEEELRASEREEWARRGAAWDRNADQMAALADRLNLPLIEAAALAPGQQVLDLASGAGEPALSIAARVAPGGMVTATDLVPEMLAGAKRRAAESGIDTIRFEIADMEALPFADASFDRVTCRFGLMFPPNTARALGEALRVLKPGGIAAWMVWGPIENNTVLQVVDGAAQAVLGSSFLDREISPFRFAEPGKLERLMTEAGFGDIEVIDKTFAPKVPVGEPFWLPTLDMTLSHVLEDLPADRRALLDRAVEAGFAPYRDGDLYRLQSNVRIHRGTRD